MLAEPPAAGGGRDPSMIIAVAVAELGVASTLPSGPSCTAVRSKPKARSSQSMAAWASWYCSIGKMSMPLTIGARGARVLDECEMGASLTRVRDEPEAVRQPAGHVITRSRAGELAKVAVEVRLVEVAAVGGYVGEAAAVVEGAQAYPPRRRKRTIRAVVFGDGPTCSRKREARWRGLHLSSPARAAIGMRPEVSLMSRLQAKATSGDGCRAASIRARMKRSSSEAIEARGPVRCAGPGEGLDDLRSRLEPSTSSRGTITADSSCIATPSSMWAPSGEKVDLESPRRRRRAR